MQNFCGHSTNSYSRVLLIRRSVQPPWRRRRVTPHGYSEKLTEYCHARALGDVTEYLRAGIKRFDAAAHFVDQASINMQTAPPHSYWLGSALLLRLRTLCAQAPCIVYCLNIDVSLSEIVVTCGSLSIPKLSILVFSIVTWTTSPGSNVEESVAVRGVRPPTSFLRRIL